jgi:sucrose-6-phosphate hydrolase SacC (GH32 family)
MPLWGPNMSWAYAVSKHLNHWLYLEIVLEPNQWYDAMGVWSGSSTIRPDGAPFIIYTGLPFLIPIHITVPIFFVIVLWRLHC